MDYEDYFRGKNITLMRIGLLGRGVGDAAFLAECGANILVVDDAPQKVMQPSVDKLKKYKNIKFKFGKYDLRDFKNCDMVLKGAGTPLNSPEIAEAKKNKIPIEMSSSLFAKLARIPIVGVTGTRGKSTVAYLIKHILDEASGLNRHSKAVGRTARSWRAVLGGNVLGVSTLAFLSKAKQYDYTVLELDSWQLQGFGDSKLSPNISVFTTFMDDHLNYYKGDRKKYFEDKANIFKYQKSEDLLIVGKQCWPLIKKYKVKSKVVIPEEKLPEGWKINLPGKHNEYNARLAIEVARSLLIPDNVIRKALATFSPVPGRLELIRTVKGVKIYNDTNSTTPDATIVALRALGSKGPTLGIKKGRTLRNIILILGGADKGLDMGALVKEIPKYCKATIFLSGMGTEKLLTNNPQLTTNEIAKSMKEAVVTAVKLAKKGDIVILSPAFASFGMFKNEYDRGEQFNKLVGSL